MLILIGCGNGVSPGSRQNASPLSTAEAEATPDLETDLRTLYNCESGATIWASYPNQDTAIVEYQGETLQLTRAVSGSGARYVNPQWVWWTKGTGAGASGTLARHRGEEQPEDPLERCAEGAKESRQPPVPRGAETLASRSLDSRLINPVESVGPITRGTSEQDLIDWFGVENVTSVQLEVGEGQRVSGTRLFAGRLDELEIEWKGDRRSPKRMTIRTPGSSWRTHSGLKIRDSLEDVTLTNGRPFNLTGLGWDYPGRTLGWNGGTLPPELQLEFRATQQIPAQQMLMGEGPYSSSHPSFQNMGLVIETIYIRWD